MKGIKEHSKIIIAVIVGMLISAGISVYATSTYYASQITYKNGKTVEQALNELYASNLYEVVESGTYTSSNVSSKQYITQTINLENSYEDSDNAYFIIKNITSSGDIIPYADLLNTGGYGICTKVTGNVVNFVLNNGSGNNATGSITIDYAIVKKNF